MVSSSGSRSYTFNDDEKVMPSSSSSGSKSEIFNLDEKVIASSSSSGSMSEISNVDEKVIASSLLSGSKTEISEVDGKLGPIKTCSSCGGITRYVFKVDDKAMDSSSSSSASKTFILKSSDDECFMVDEKVGSQCQTIKHMIEDLDGNNHVIPVANVKGDILSKVLEYCKKHAEYQGIAEDSPAKELEQWDQEYLDIDLNILYEVILAANFLAVKDLVDLTLQCVANMIKGKKPHEIRAHFNIKNDLPPDKEEQIRQDFYWLDLE